jgi:hypothetical protein
MSVSLIESWQARSAKEAGKDGRHEQVLRMLENAHQFRANPQRGDGSAGQSNGASPTAAHGRNGQPHNAGEDVTSVEPRDPILARQYAQRLIPLLARVTQVPSITALNCWTLHVATMMLAVFAIFCCRIYWSLTS